MSQANSNKTSKVITDHLDIWTSAIKTKSASGRGTSNKRELYGIKKLRELILDLAVRGLLVPQDPNDKPASELLKKIASEKEQLIKEGKIKKQKALPEISEDEKPFNLPVGWSFVRLGQIGWVTSSSRVHKKDWKSEGVPFYRAREIVKLSNDGFVDNELFISNQLFDQFKTNGLIPLKNDLMITGVGTIGVPYIVQGTDEFYFKDASVLIFKNLFKLNSQYLRLLMKSPYWNKVIHKGSMGTTVHTLTITRANPVVFPIAPINEQKRIVAKVDELMTLCDQLEQQTEDSIQAHELLVENLLKALTDAKDHKTFQQAWLRIAQNFDVLFTTEHSIDQLKQTILQLAVMGKLVPQDPNDEPASELLKKIKAEKEKLIKEGKIKKEKTLPPISDKEKPFELPSDWVWTRLGNTGIGSTGKTPSTKISEYFEGNIPFIGPGQITPEGELLEPDKFLSEKGIDQSTEANVGDILMVCIGGSIGKGAISNKRLAFNQQINCIRPIHLSSSYLYISISTQEFYFSILKKATGSATPIINRSKWEELLIPLCSIEEQKRIVAKVDELMALCDQMKSKITNSKKLQSKVADSLTQLN